MPFPVAHAPPNGCPQLLRRTPVVLAVSRPHKGALSTAPRNAATPALLDVARSVTSAGTGSSVPAYRGVDTPGATAAQRVLIQAGRWPPPIGSSPAGLRHPSSARGAAAAQPTARRVSPGCRHSLRATRAARPDGAPSNHTGLPGPPPSSPNLVFDVGDQFTRREVSCLLPDAHAPADYVTKRRGRTRLLLGAVPSNNHLPCGPLRREIILVQHGLRGRRSGRWRRVDQQQVPIQAVQRDQAPADDPSEQEPSYEAHEVPQGDPQGRHVLQQSGARPVDSAYDRAASYVAYWRYPPWPYLCVPPWTRDRTQPTR